MPYTNLLKAISFAADKHCKLRRKDRDESPYINHPIAVATILAQDADIDDETLLIAAILHDTIEDTETTFDELVNAFGIAVAEIVQEVTDDKNIDKKVRKQLQIEHAPHISDSAKQVKIADKICNIRDVIHSPPHDWSLNRRKEYLEWAGKVVDGCRGVNQRLEKVFDDACAEGNGLFSAE